MVSKIKTILVILVVAVSVWLVSIVLFPINENDRIEKVVRQAAAAFEAKSSKEVASFLTKDFKVEKFADRETTLNYLKAFFFKVRDVKVNIKYLKHEIDRLPATASEARVLGVVVITGNVDGQKFQAFSGQGADTGVLTLRKVEGSWLISAAHPLDTADPEKAFQQLAK
ncbi:MAG: hypothetical protein CVV42_07890 [Candidatus Riflebacteria bacterium HGW-Riflebacteria-2]|jgi:hypothetical protein|nr:MAG: hypothetical protein CVV42_07890 [Candidatus Riflebacteria bacterium HGW-Riflebacteria-2]